MSWWLQTTVPRFMFSLEQCYVPNSNLLLKNMVIPDATYQALLVLSFVHDSSIAAAFFKLPGL